jgi:predicted transcriptional regulator
MSETTSPPLLQLTAKIVAGYASHNRIDAPGLLRLIETVYSALAGSGSAAAAEGAPQPAVPIKRSVFPGYLVCLEDGKKLKMLKRHLMTTYGLTPEQYRQKWGLPPSYPMVAPEYAARRSRLAKEIGLGRLPAAKAPAAPASAAAPPPSEPARRPRRGRPTAASAR